MPRDPLSGLILAVGLKREGSASLQRQLYSQIRSLILSGQLASGVRLPSSRTLSGDLKCARNTVLAAFDQLFAEGYLETRHGSGTYIARILPETLLEPSATTNDRHQRANDLPLSSRGELLASLARESPPQHIAFSPSLPDVLEFPFEKWHRIHNAIWREPTRSLATHFDPAGYEPLRIAIANYLRTSRLVECEPSQVVITTGVQHSIDLIARILLNPGDVVWAEDPGYREVRSPLLASGANPVPIPIDSEGLSVIDGARIAPNARMALVTPSHQYPTGVVMSARRRLDLLAHAARAGMWIVEDDYDSEFRYSGEPLAALQGLDRGERVIYVGTLSKVLFPALRLGYLVLPRRIAGRFLKARTTLDVHPPLLEQPVLARFINEGHLSSHIRRMRGIYQQRQQALRESLHRYFGEDLFVGEQRAGLHLLAHMRGNLLAGMSDVEAAARARSRGIIVHPLSNYYWGERRTDALLFGFGCVSQKRIPLLVSELSQALMKSRGLLEYVDGAHTSEMSEPIRAGANAAQGACGDL